MSENDRKNQVLSIRTMPSNQWFYFAIFLFVFSYYYFFTEGVPWFWYDDIYWIEQAEKTSVLALIKSILDFTHGSYIFERPVLTLFMKICGFLFNENPHYYRILKIIIFSVSIAMMFYLVVKHGGDKLITVSGLFVFATFPAVMIVNAWINESAAFELLFKIGIFIIFFILVSEEGKKLSLRTIVIGGLPILLLLFDDKSKATAKIIPFIFLTYLILTRSKKIFLYVISLVSIPMILPHAALKTSKPLGAYLTSYHVNLLKTFLSQIWPLLIFSLVIIVLTKNRAWLKSRFMLFSFLWLIYEMLFYILYPSDEMRYLFSSLAAATVLFSVLTSSILVGLEKNRFKKAIKYGFIVVIVSMLAFNGYWSYNFRGSFASYFVLIDKKMKFINQNYKNALCLYADSTKPYYSRNTSNKYINLNPQNAWNEKNDEVILSGTGIKILNSSKYENIVVLNHNLIRSSGRLVSFDSIIYNSLYDLFQGKMKFKIHAVNLYNISLMPTAYPLYPLYSGVLAIEEKKRF